MSTLAELPGQQSAPPPVPTPSTTGAAAENTVTPPASTKETVTPPETMAAELDAEEQAQKAKHGDSWAIKAYREEKTKASKYKDIRDVVDRIGNPELVKSALAVVESLGDPTVPIAEAKTELLEFDPDRYNELRNDFYTEFVDHHADRVASDIVGQKTTVAEIRAALAGNKGGAGKTTALKSKAVGYKVPDDLAIDYPEAAEALAELQAQLAENEQGKAEPAKTEDGKAVELQKQLDALNTEKQKEAYEAEVNQHGAALYQDVYSEVSAVLQELGLAPDKEDPEDLASLKEAACDYLGDRDRVEREFDKTEENVKLADRVMGHLARKQWTRANQYVPTVKVGIRAAVEALANDRKGKALVDAVKRELLALSKSGTTGKAGGKGPLIGGTAAGAVAPKVVHGKGDDAMWDEMEQRVRERQASAGR